MSKSNDFPSVASGLVRQVVEQEADGPIVKLVNRMIEDAYSRKATEIHCDPTPGCAIVFHLEDGAAKERMRIPLRAHPNVVNRLKIMAGLSPFPGAASGRIVFRRFSRKGLDVNLAVEFLPLPSGERAIVRFLPDLPEPQPLTRCGYRALVILLLEEAHALGVRELHWEPGEQPRILRVRDGRLEERLRLPPEAFQEQLRVLRNLAGMSSGDDEGRFELTPHSQQQLELEAHVTATQREQGQRLVVALKPLR